MQPAHALQKHHILKKLESMATGNITLVMLLTEVVYFLDLKYGALLSRNAPEI